MPRQEKAVTQGERLAYRFEGRLSGRPESSVFSGRVEGHARCSGIVVQSRVDAASWIRDVS